MTNIFWPPPTPDSLGPLLGADDVRDAIKATLDTWTPYYIAIESERLVGAGKIGGANQPTNPLPIFGTWVNELTHRNVGTGQPAAYEVTCPGTVGPPELSGVQQCATYAGVIRVQVFGTDWQEAADLTSYYEKAVRWAILQHRSLGHFAQATKWVGTAYEGIAHSSTRTEGIATCRYDVRVLNVTQVDRGPATVPAQPWVAAPPQDPTVGPGDAGYTVVTVAKTPVDQPLP